MDHSSVLQVTPTSHRACVYLPRLWEKSLSLNSRGFLHYVAEEACFQGRQGHGSPDLRRWRQWDEDVEGALWEAAG